MHIPVFLIRLIEAVLCWVGATFTEVFLNTGDFRTLECSAFGFDIPITQVHLILAVTIAMTAVCVYSGTSLKRAVCYFVLGVTFRLALVGAGIQPGTFHHYVDALLELLSDRCAVVVLLSSAAIWCRLQFWVYIYIAGSLTLSHYSSVWITKNWTKPTYGDFGCTFASMNCCDKTTCSSRADPFAMIMECRKGLALVEPSITQAVVVGHEIVCECPEEEGSAPITCETFWKRKVAPYVSLNIRFKFTPPGDPEHLYRKLLYTHTTCFSIFAAALAGYLGWGWWDWFIADIEIEEEFIHERVRHLLDEVLYDNPNYHLVHDSVGANHDSITGTIIEKPSGEADQPCAICMERPREVLSLPCRHHLLCIPCHKEATRTQGPRCVLCRNITSDTIVCRVDPARPPAVGDKYQLAVPFYAS